MIQTIADNASKRELSPYGNLPWKNDGDPPPSHDVIPWSDQRDNPSNNEALYERRELDDSSSSRSLIRFLATFTSESVHLSKEISTSSTAPEFLSFFPTFIFHQICSAAKDEVFEHGMESVFSLSLASFIESYQGLAISIVSQFLASGSLDKVVSMETLHQMGLSEHEPTYDARLNLLLQNLNNDLAMVRYGAMYGLSSMDDPTTIPEIERVYKIETDPYLQKYMSAALSQLRETQSGA